MISNKRNLFLTFWASQSVSEWGSSMTAFALILWVYSRTKSALAVSLLAFFSYLPSVAVSLFSGAFLDAHRKKPVLLGTDFICALCTAAVFALLSAGRLELWQIYLANGISGAMNAFQMPASAVAVGMLVPGENYEKASGLNSLSGSLISVLTPPAAVFVCSFWGTRRVLLIDLLTFCFAFLILLFRIPIPESAAGLGAAARSPFLRKCRDGFRFLSRSPGLLSLILSMAAMNFLSSLTYENILPAMILSRSGGNRAVLGFVSGTVGLGGILGGLFASFGKLPENKIRLIYGSAAVSFLFGDLLMGAGQNCVFWCAAGLAASFPIPFVAAGQNGILYRRVPSKLQGRVFAARNALQYFTIPTGILAGGILSDNVLEPFMKSSAPLALALHRIVGQGAGSGMAVLFLCTGTLGFLTSALWYRSREVRKLNKQICFTTKF